METTEREIVNNKELVPLGQYLEAYAQADPQYMSQRSGIPYTETDGTAGLFTLRFLGADYRVSWPEFNVKADETCSHTDRTAGTDLRPAEGGAAAVQAAEESDTAASEARCPLLWMNSAKIFVLRYLLEGAAAPSTGKFLSYREVPGAEVYYRQYAGRCLSRMAWSYGKRPEAFARGMERLGAVRLSGREAGGAGGTDLAYGTGSADFAYECELLPLCRMRFCLWTPDEEFPPSAQILFSDNFPAIFHTEDLVVAAEIVLSTLKRLNA